MLGHAAIFILFQLLESIEYSTLNLSSLLQVGVWAAPRVRSLPKKKKIVAKDINALSFGTHVWNTLRITRSEVLHTFTFKRHFQTIFQNGCNNLHSHQSCVRNSVPLQTCLHGVLTFFF